MLPLTRYFLEPQLVPWFWLLVPFILIYLIKPKPVNQTIPSLMFLLQDKGKAFRNSFLKYLYRDFVFFLQLLTLTLLIAAACQPFINVPKTTLISNAVIVLDASASMQTDDGRWEQALAEAKNHLARQNTIILVLNRPSVVVQHVSKGDAQAALNSLDPSDTETNLYAAIAAAREFSAGPDTTVTIISDFKNSDEQQDYHAAIKTVQATGATVNIVTVGGPASNVGITSMVVEEKETTIWVKNFNDQATAVDIQVGSLEQTLPLGPKSVDSIKIATPPGVTEVEIDANDDFELDNTATIMNNADLDMSILVITNDDNVRQSPFWYTLQAIDATRPLTLDISVSNPPALPSIDHDIVVFYHVDPSLLVQRTVREVANAVRSGNTAAIIMYQDDLPSIDFEGMLPYTYDDLGGQTTLTTGELTALVKDVEFGTVPHYQKATGTGRVLAKAADSTPVVSIHTAEKGLVLYYGIDDSAASFSKDPTSYSKFWKGALDELSGRVSPERLNYRTGSAPLFTGQPDETPKDTQWAGILDVQGVYSFGDYSVAANLLSAAESDVSANVEDAELAEIAQQSTEESYKQKELTSFILLLVLVLLFLELFIVKYRGDF